MIKVRDANLGDIEFLMEKAYAFNDRYYGIPLDPGGLYRYIEAMIESPDGVCLISDTGGIVGVIHKDPRWDWKVLVETAWYSEGRDGLRLIRAFEERGMEVGCNEVRMTTLAVNPGVDRLLARRGYKPIETSHRLIL